LPSFLKDKLYLDLSQSYYEPPRCFEWVVTSVSDHGWMFLGSAERRFSVPA